jgi:superfamily II DNA/RNA helicase
MFLGYEMHCLFYQVGIPSDREQYIHRLERTGLFSKSGKGILLLAPFEECFLNDLKNLPLEKAQAPELDTDMKLVRG